MKLPLTGRCQCGAVHYEIRSEPFSVWACHCTDCQKQSGSAYALSMLVKRDSIAVTKGEPASWQRTADSGRGMECFYCRDCGSRLWHNGSATTATSVIKPGTLDDTSWLYPVGHLWTQSKQPWVQIADDAIAYQQQFPDPTRMIEAWAARSKA